MLSLRTMNDLEKYFNENTGRVIHKWPHYFEAYDRHLSRFRGTDVHLVEFGVSHGGSLQMWKNYFGPRAKIFGVDINPHCQQLAEEQVEIFIGDQGDRKFLKSLAAKIPRIDVLIDDGGHTMEQQINTYEELFGHIEPQGVYICEDIHTSYWPDWNGGYRRPGTFIEYSKAFIDHIHAWHSAEPAQFNVTKFTESVHSLHYYDSMLVVEKRPIVKPFPVKKGTLTVPPFEAPKRTIPPTPDSRQPIWRRLKKALKK